MSARYWLAAVLSVLALGAAACGGIGPAQAATPSAATSAATPTAAPAPSSAAAAKPAGAAQSVSRKVEVTFYAAADNDPPGSADIAYPNSRHATAGGTGTVDDPLSLATDPREIRPGVLVYYPPVQKYYVMEDDCAPCIDEWNANRNPHVDLWMANSTDPAVQDCEAAFTPDDPDTIIINPPTNLPVDTTPLFAGGKCVSPTPR
jgi:3D (Asp-Asp-Asp) domain-containing protein